MRGVREVAPYRFVRSHLLVADEDSPEACPYEVVQSCKYNL